MKYIDIIFGININISRYIKDADINNSNNKIVININNIQYKYLFNIMLFILIINKAIFTIFGYISIFNHTISSLAINLFDIFINIFDFASIFNLVDIFVLINLLGFKAYYYTNIFDFTNIFNLMDILGLLLVILLIFFI